MMSFGYLVNLDLRVIVQFHRCDCGHFVM